MVGFIETVSSLTSRCHRRHVTLVFNLLRLAPPTVRGGPVQPTKCTHQKCNHEVTKTRSTHEESTQRLSSWFRVFVAKNVATTTTLRFVCSVGCHDSDALLEKASPSAR